MGHEEARKFWEHFDNMSKDVQLEYMNERFGDLAYEMSREWEDIESEHETLE